MVVWVDSWQMECCGDPFSVGSRVGWTLHEQVDREWLASVLGDAPAATVTHAEEHHGGLPQDAPVTLGVVTRVRAVSCQYAPDPAGYDDRTIVPVRDTAVATDLDEVGRWFEPAAPLQHVGYLVDLQPVRG